MLCSPGPVRRQPFVAEAPGLMLAVLTPDGLPGRWSVSRPPPLHRIGSCCIAVLPPAPSPCAPYSPLPPFFLPFLLACLLWRVCLSTCLPSCMYPRAALGCMGGAACRWHTSIHSPTHLMLSAHFSAHLCSSVPVCPHLLWQRSRQASWQGPLPCSLPHPVPPPPPPAQRAPAGR